MEHTMTDRLIIGGSALLAMTLLLAPQTTEARAVKMVESNPQAETIIHGDHAEYVVRFNGPVNHYASRLEIVQDGRVVRTLLPLENAAVDVLFAAGPVPAPGRYALRWTAISADGEQSSGEIPFTVQQ
jgi:copper resistance protein C